jgi:Domain of unknown function (DUF5122) beta-propeller
LNADGTLDTNFNSGEMNGWIGSAALQTDGKIVIGGAFTQIGDQARNRLARLGTDGTLDPTFDPVANDLVYTLALQADGKILAGGRFTTLGGFTRSYFGRLNNTDPAVQTLSFDGSTVTWLRSGTCPEVWRTSFEIGTSATNWTSLGSGIRIPGGWQLKGVFANTNSTIRARGFVSNRPWFIEQIYAVDPKTPPKILTDDGSFGVVSNRFRFNIVSFPGQAVVTEATTNLVQWIPIQTNLVGDPGIFMFQDLKSDVYSRRFYRAVR